MYSNIQNMEVDPSFNGVLLYTFFLCSQEFHCGDSSEMFGDNYPHGVLLLTVGHVGVTCICLFR